MLPRPASMMCMGGGADDCCGAAAAAGDAPPPPPATDDGQRPRTQSLDHQHPPPKEVTVALIQAASQMGGVAANTARLERHCRKAAAAGAKIMVLPEAAVSGYLSQDLAINWRLDGRPLDSRFAAERCLDPRSVAEPQGGASVVHFAKLAAELAAYITVPFIEVETATGRLFNAVSLVGPAGQVS
eukprot:SAG31_NODE_3848_length_3818_cov_14.439634_2_plen_185_part_00